MVRKKILVRGIVQGVGFRPFIHNLAETLSLKGYVRNDTIGVYIEIEGAEEKVSEFVSRIEREAPSLSRIERIREHDLPPVGYREFKIDLSQESEERFTLISPDIATCEDCLKELFGSGDRRFRYPFINCTKCGPRFTIIADIPYDRDKTTMAEFTMCPACRKEYEDPDDRRFHAQPDACPQCGPSISLIDNLGKEVASEEPIRLTHSFLKEGKIVAVKGLGGFHLACDATNRKAVSVLRERKHRDDKPFALMAPSMQRIEDICEVSPEEERLLLSPRRPIVLLKQRSPSPIAEEVAPRLGQLGFMLPYTPLHHLLLEDSDLVLVMTSGNLGDEPIAYQNQEAFSRLKPIADYFLTGNRKISVRCDDSVVRVCHGEVTILRRARGWVPEPIKLPFETATQILATGGELKNTFCLTKGGYAFLSQHIGDLENLETLTSFERAMEHFKKLFHIEPELIVYDLHPEYLSTKYALAIQGVEKVGVQHHFAHIASCLADNSVDESVIGVAFDGTGYGLDGNIWGGEFLIGGLRNFKRAAHFKYIPMPGGESAIKEPWRMAFSYLYYAFGEKALELTALRRFEREKLCILRSMVDSGINSPLTSSAGRLFDGVSSIVGVRDVVNYEGQAAIELEQIASTDCGRGYHFEITHEDSMILIDPGTVIAQVLRDVEGGVTPSVISGRFHEGMAQLILNASSILRDRYGLSSVALSGGVFQNQLLLNRANHLLRENGFKVYTHHLVPPNDGGLCLGQAVMANADGH